MVIGMKCCAKKTYSKGLTAFCQNYVSRLDESKIEYWHTAICSTPGTVNIVVFAYCYCFPRRGFG